MQFESYIRKPFTIQAVQITEQNMDEICELIGHEVKDTDGKKYISVNRRIVPNGHKAFVGWWVTLMGDNYRVYSKGSFKNQFIFMDEQWTNWFNKQQNGNISQDEHDADVVMSSIEDGSNSDQEATFQEETPSSEDDVSTGLSTEEVS